MALVHGISDFKNGLMYYHVIFAEYKRRWIDTASAARLRVVANFCSVFFLLKYVVVVVVVVEEFEK